MTREPILFIKKDNKLTANLLFSPLNIIKMELWDDKQASGYRDILKIVSTLLKYDDNTLNIDIAVLKVIQIPYVEEKEFLKEPNSPNSYPQTADKTHWLLFSENGMFHKYQILITYEHNHDNEYSGPRNHIANSIKSNKTIDLFVFGDSISAGANSSFLMKLKPLIPPYADLLAQNLQSKFPSKTINMINKSVGGMSSIWGKKVIQSQIESIKKENPEFNFDINILAWGANDSGGKCKPKQFVKNNEYQIRSILQVNSKAQFILVSSSLPNPLWANTHYDLLFKYRELHLKRTANVKKWGSHTIIADISQLWQDMLKIKNYYDLTGNGINHPNDFGHKIYADYLISLLL
jgi:acyl-CoA thioesterase-1